MLYTPLLAQERDVAQRLVKQRRAAFEVALSGDGPVHLSFVAAGIKLIFLLGKKRVSQGGFTNDFVLKGRVKELLHFFSKPIFRDVVKAVALGDQRKLFLVQKYRDFFLCVKDRIWNLTPTAQAVLGIQNIEHRLFLSQLLGHKLLVLNTATGTVFVISLPDISYHTVGLFSESILSGTSMCASS